MRLEAPQAITASDGEFDDHIRISWDTPEVGPAPESYEIRRATSETGAYTAVGSTTAGTMEFNDIAITDGADYWYAVVSRASGYADSTPGQSDSGMRNQLMPPGP